MDREAVDEIKRHFDVVAAELRSEIRAVAERMRLLADQLEGLIRRIDAFEKRVHHELEGPLAEGVVSERRAGIEHAGRGQR